MKRLLACAALSTAVCASTSFAGIRADGGFEFVLPAGFEVLPPEPPAAGALSKVAVLAGMKGAGFFKATVRTGVTAIIDETQVREAAEAFAERDRPAGGKSRVVESAVVEVLGRPCGRFVLEFDQGDRPLTALAYIIPARNASAVLFFSIRSDRFAELAPSLDAAARATVLHDEDGPPAWVFKVGMLGAMGVVLLALELRQRWKRKTSS